LGCGSLKIQNLHVSQPKSSTIADGSANSQAPGQERSRALRPVQLRSNLTEYERRRTQRVLLRVRASIHVALQGQAKKFDVATLSVNPHGAVVIMNQSLPAHTEVVLEHAGTKERVACKVVKPPRQMAEGYHVPLEFDSPAPGFWKIDFPPSDWRPDEL
jgi:predicted NAD/FAD-binding protein